MLRLALACLVLGLIATPAANAASSTDVLRDCADDGVLQGSYTPSELRKARQNIPTDTDEYTDCRDVLARALTSAIAGTGGGPTDSGSDATGGAGGGGGGSGGGGSGLGGGADELITPTTQADRDAIANAAGAGAPDALNINGRSVVPGSSGLTASAVRNGLPTPLVATLALLAAAALAATLPFARRHVLARFKR